MVNTTVPKSTKLLGNYQMQVQKSSMINSAVSVSDKIELLPSGCCTAA